MSDPNGHAGYQLRFQPIFAVANNHCQDCGEPPSMVDMPDQRKRCFWYYFENEDGEQVIACYDRDKEAMHVYHGDCGWDNLLIFDEFTGHLINAENEDVVTLDEPEKLFLTACFKAGSVNRVLREARRAGQPQ